MNPLVELLESISPIGLNGGTLLSKVGLSLVNTRVKDPTHRQVNRKLDRQKKAMMRQNRRVLLDPLDSEASLRAEVHKMKIAECKRARGANP